MKISNKEELEEYYENEQIAQNYWNERFKKPIYLFEHQQQVREINTWILKKKCPKILEVACGPARLTNDLSVTKGIVVDNSGAMLKIAREKMPDTDWKFIRGDAFRLPFEENSFDILICFRFIRHFEKDNRDLLYKEFSRVLKPGGVLIFDAVNKTINSVVRKIVGEHKYAVYDKLYLHKELINEPGKENFDVLKTSPILKHFFIEIAISKLASSLNIMGTGIKLMGLLEKLPGNLPLEWVVVCQKR